MGYFGNILHGIRTLANGLGLTRTHMGRASRRRRPVGAASAQFMRQPEGLVTTIYPREALPVPDVGRYRLVVEIDDCIACDQCARVCPVDCITIEKVKAVEELGLTSDGTKVKFHLPTFDIDMAKCCYCGLCTVVCPTECIVMTPVHDFAETNRENFLYHYGNLSPGATSQKQAELAAFEAEQKRLKAEALAAAKAKNATGATPPAQPATTK